MKKTIIIIIIAIVVSGVTVKHKFIDKLIGQFHYTVLKFYMKGYLTALNRTNKKRMYLDYSITYNQLYIEYKPNIKASRWDIFIKITNELNEKRIH